MYKLKIKRTDQQSITTKYFNTIQEVSDYLRICLNVKSLDDMLRLQKEFNFRFYLSYKKEN